MVTFGEFDVTVPLVRLSESTGLSKNDCRVMPPKSRDDVFTVSENSSDN